MHETLGKSDKIPWNHCTEVRNKYKQYSNRYGRLKYILIVHCACINDSKKKKKSLRISCSALYCNLLRKINQVFWKLKKISAIKRAIFQFFLEKAIDNKRLFRNCSMRKKKIWLKQFSFYVFYNMWIIYYYQTFFREKLKIACLITDIFFGFQAILLIFL